MRNFTAVAKGWIYVGMAITALLFLLREFETRQPIKSPPVETVAETASSTAPNEPPEKTGEEGTETEESEAANENVPPQPESISTTSTTTNEPQPMSSEPERHEPLPAETHEAEAPNDEPQAVAQKATEEEVPAVAPTETPQAVEETSGEEEASQATEDAPVITSENECPLLPEMDASPDAASLHQGITLTNPLDVRAQASGKIVKLTQAEITGHTLYIVSHDGRTCLVYGGLNQLAEGLAQDKEIHACQSLGSASERLIYQKLHIPEGQPWWKGQVAGN